ncbi:MAG: hypothetical protein JOZ09_17475 [Pseudonocardiales bacterium]|nr:hypothetical protein [Pseudonocardiales bacterium]
MSNEVISTREPKQSSAQVEQSSAGAFDFGATGVRIHATFNADSTVLGEGNPGDGATLLEVELNGQFIVVSCNRPDGSSEWDKVTNNKTGITGWVVACFIVPQ